MREREREWAYVPIFTWDINSLICIHVYTWMKWYCCLLTMVTVSHPLWLPCHQGLHALLSSVRNQSMLACGCVYELTNDMVRVTAALYFSWIFSFSSVGHVRCELIHTWMCKWAASLFVFFSIVYMSCSYAHPHVLVCLRSCMYELSQNLSFFFSFHISHVCMHIYTYVYVYMHAHIY